MGHGPAVSTLVDPPGVVAGLLSFRASPPSTASDAHAATRTRRQTSSATLPATDASDGSRQNQPAMVDERGALLPIAVRFRLRTTQARCGWLVMVRGSW